MKDPMKKKEK